MGQKSIKIYFDEDEYMYPRHLVNVAACNRGANIPEPRVTNYLSDSVSSFLAN